MFVSPGPIWMVPRRPDPDFVGRAAELAALEKTLAATGSSALTQPASVHGLGGVGKTLLAVEFAHRHADAYHAVFWLAAENPTTLASAFAELTRELGLPEAGEPDQNVRIAAVLRWLEAHPRWLLVFDNAERREDVEPYVPRRHAGHVLITSRNPDWHGLARAVKVRPLPRAESIDLLRKGLESGDEAEADRLAEALGDLPLALAQAAAFVQETGVRFADYLERFHTRWAEFDREQRAEPGYGRSIAVTLSLTLDRLREGGADASPAETLLAHCAFYAPERIPRDLLADEFADGAHFNDAIRTLRSYSLVESEAGTVTVHRLVQRAVRGRMSSDRQAEYAEHAVRQLHERFPSNSHDVRTWPACRQLLDHALHATEYAMEHKIVPTTLADLLNRVGVYLFAIHDQPRAKEQLLRAQWIYEMADGSDHPNVAIALGNLGIVARDMGELDEARRCQERALRIFETAYGPDHPQVARTLGNLGNVAQTQGDLAEARRCQERALRIKEAAYGPDHPEVAITLGNLGLVALDQGDLAEARRCQERALRIFEAAYGPDHPDVAITLGNLGNVARDQGDLAEARRCQERALRIKEAAYGPDHPEVAITLGNLGTVAQDQEDLAEARWCQERALRIKEAAYGPDHPDVAITLTNLGLTARIQGDLTEARRCQERALWILERAYGPNHPDVASLLNNLADLYDSQGRYTEAEPLFQRALAIRETLLGPDHLSVATSLSNLAGLFDRQGRSAEAEPVYRKALTIIESHLGLDHPYTQALQEKFARLQSKHRGPMKG